LLLDAHDRIVANPKILADALEAQATFHHDLLHVEDLGLAERQNGGERRRDARVIASRDRDEDAIAHGLRVGGCSVARRWRDPFRMHGL
jgi:hypothetical protein